LCCSRKRFNKRDKDLTRMRQSAVRHENEASQKWMHTEEQVEAQITLAKLRPYYPSYMWKPLDPTPQRLLDLLSEQEEEKADQKLPMGNKR